MKHLHIEHISSPCESASLVQHTGLMQDADVFNCYIDFDHYDNDCDDDDNDDNDNYNDMVMRFILINT